MTITTETLTRNIAKSGEVLNWNGFSPFQLHLGLIRYHSQSASCHIAKRCAQVFRLLSKYYAFDVNNCCQNNENGRK